MGKAAVMTRSAAVRAKSQKKGENTNNNNNNGPGKPQSSPNELSPRKKVDFPENLTPDNNDSPSSPPDSSSRPEKSILKNKDTNTASPLKSFNSSSPMVTAQTLHDIYSSAVDLDVIENIDDIVKVALSELEKNEGTEGKNYTYAALHSSLRAKPHTPEQAGPFITKYGNALLRYSKRDIVALNDPYRNPAQANTLISILKVVDYLFFTCNAFSTIDTSLANWFLHRGLEALESQDTSRSVLGIYLHIFNYQKLPQGIGSDMCQRLLTIVIKGSRYPSPTIVCEYLAVYKLLMRNSTQLMLNRINDWLPYCFRSLAHVNSTVQKQALLVLQDATTRYLGRKELATCSMNTLSEDVVLPSPNGDETTHNIPLIDVLCKQITTSLTMNSGVISALSIWKTVLIAVFQTSNLSEKIYNWSHFEKFVRLSKLGFNSDNGPIKCSTVSSWKVPIILYTYSTPFYQYPSNELDTSILVLLHPFKLFETSQSPKTFETLRSSFYSLLFMSLRSVPNLNQNSMQLSIVWDKIITPVCHMLLRSNEGRSNRLIIDLLRRILNDIPYRNNSPSKNSHPTNSSSRILRMLNDDFDIDVQDIPEYPSKWLRANVMRVLSMFSYVFKEKSINQSSITSLWDSLLMSVNQVVKRDIKISLDTMDTIAGICNFVRDCLKQETPGIYALCNYLITSAIDTFGISLFTDFQLDVCPETSIVFAPSKRRASKPDQNIITIDPTEYLLRIIAKYCSTRYGTAHELFESVLYKFKQGCKNYSRFHKILLGLADSFDPYNFKFWAITANCIVTIDDCILNAKFEEYESFLLWLITESNSEGLLERGSDWKSLLSVATRYLKQEENLDVTDFASTILEVFADKNFNEIGEHYLIQGLLQLLTAIKSNNETTNTISESIEERVAVQTWACFLEDPVPKEVLYTTLREIDLFVSFAISGSSALHILMDKMLSVVIPKIVNSFSGSNQDESAILATLFGKLLIRLSEKEKSKVNFSAPTAKAINTHADLLVRLLKSDNRKLSTEAIEVWNNFCRHKKGNVTFAPNLVDTILELHTNDNSIIVPKSFNKKKSPVKPANNFNVNKGQTMIPDSVANVDSNEDETPSSTPLTRSQTKKLESGSQSPLVPVSENASPKKPGTSPAELNSGTTFVEDSQMSQDGPVFPAPARDDDDPFVSDTENSSGDMIFEISPSLSPQQIENNTPKKSPSTVPRAPPKTRLLSAQSDDISTPKLWNSPKRHSNTVHNGDAKSAGIIGKYIGSFISSFRGQNEKGEDSASPSNDAVIPVREFQQLNENADYSEGFKRKRKRSSNNNNNATMDKSKKRKNLKRTSVGDEEEEDETEAEGAGEVAAEGVSNFDADDVKESGGTAALEASLNSDKGNGYIDDDETAFKSLLSLLDRFDHSNDYVKSLNQNDREKYQTMLFKRFSGLYNTATR